MHALFWVLLIVVTGGFAVVAAVEGRIDTGRLPATSNEVYRNLGMMVKPGPDGHSGLARQERSWRRDGL